MGNCKSVGIKQNDDKYHTIELETNSYNNVDLFTFNKHFTKAKVVDVYDGDTILIVFYYRDIPFKTKFRMYGYDSPELKPLKNIDNRELHIKCAKKARDMLSEQILDKIVWVSFVEEEKYGRTMGKIYKITNQNFYHPTDLCYNNWMIDNKLGKIYDGGKKIEFSKQELDEINAK